MTHDLKIKPTEIKSGILKLNYELIDLKLEEQS